MSSPTATVVRRYLIGLAAVLAAAVMHHGLRLVSGLDLGMAPFVAAIAAAAWLAGAGPAGLATLVSLGYFLLFPFQIEVGGIVAGTIWLCGGMALSSLVGRGRRGGETGAFLMAASRSPILVADTQGRIVSMNAAARSLTTGVSASGASALVRELTALASDNAGPRTEFALEYPRHSTRIFDVTASSHGRGDSGRSVFVLHPHHSVPGDDAKSAPVSNLLQSLVEGCEARMFHVEPGFHLTWSNRSFRERHESQGNEERLVWKLFDAQTCAALWSPLHRGMSGQYESLEWRAQDKHGNSILTLCMISPDFDESGQVRGCFVLCVDAGLLLGDRLRQYRSDDQRRSVLENLPDLVWTAAADGTEEWFNQRWTEYTGSSVNTWTEAMPPADRDRATAAWKRARTAGTQLRIECRIRRHDGELRWHLVRMHPLRDLANDAVIWAWAGSCTDIDDRKQADARLRNTQQRVAGFIGKVSHELRNPLAALSASIHVLRHPRAQPPMIARALDALERQSVSMTRLVDEILQATQLIDGRIELQCRTIELGQLASEVCLELAGRAEARDISLKCDIPGKALPLVADPQRIKQTLKDLTLRALDSCSAADTVSLHVIDADPGEAGIRIADTGRGLSRDELDNIFELGSADGGEQNCNRGGLGLGLNVARQIVQLHGGRIVAASEGPGMGSTFDVFLPLQAAPESGPAVGAGALAHPGGG